MSHLIKNDDGSQSLILDNETNLFYMLAEDETGVHETPIDQKILSVLNKGVWRFSTQKTKRHNAVKSSVSTHCLSALFAYLSGHTIRNNYKVVVYNDVYRLTLVLS